MIFASRVFPFLILLWGISIQAADIQRFPPPDFESGYTFPTTQTPLPKGVWRNALDILALAAALSVSSYLVIKKRSRNGIFLLTLFSLVYFGFIREGCICAIGAIQNVTLALFDDTYAIPYTVIAFFSLPLVFTLFFGRVFCAAVCPLGAIQDLVLIKPIKVPHWLNHALGLLVYLYFGAAILFAATGSAFLICQYDPFVAFFRLSGNATIVILGVCLLVISLFVGRPYCLYLCPYSVLLRFFSRFSQYRVTVGPDEGECVECESCEEACPFGQIAAPTADSMPHPNPRDRMRVWVLVALTPLIMLLGGYVTSRAGATFSRMNYTVQVAERIAWEDAGQVEGFTDASKAFRDSGRPKQDLFEEAQKIRRQFYIGCWILGAFLGLVIAAKLITLSVFQKRDVYEADRAGCVACGRCYCSCPLERKRLRLLAKSSTQTAGS